MQAIQSSPDTSSARDQSVSKCRHCRFYQPEGRRGGACSQLGVPVQSGWNACSLSEQPFALSNETGEEAEILTSQFSLQNLKENESLIPESTHQVLA